MAEYKQYITQIQENGNVMISENVVATIVAQALSEVEGIGSLGVKPGIGIADFAAMNGVYATFFTENMPARVCYEVAKLPMGAKVEIDAILCK